MNKIVFLYKFYISKQPNGHYNFSLLFPFAGVIIGYITVALTLAIMEGMEYSIFYKLKNISFPAKLTIITSAANLSMEDLLIEKNIDYTKGLEDQVLIMHDSLFRLTNIHAIENFIKFKKQLFGNDFKEIVIDSQLPNIYIGRPLAAKLEIIMGDTIDVAIPKDINLFTGLPPKRKMIVGGIFELGVLDYDNNNIFTNYSSVRNFIPENRLLFYLSEIPDNIFLNNMIESYPQLQFKTWEDEYYSFISAMKLEKVVYSIIGFLIIGIAGMTLMSMMSLAVIEKIPQIGILKSMGATKYDIGSIFVFQALITWLISSILGIILCLLIIEIDKYYHIIGMLFPGTVYFNFPLILKNENIFLIMIISLILLLSAAIYPSNKAINLDSVDAIGFKR